MATFTMYLRDAVQYLPDIVNETLAGYEIFDEGYRDHLNRQILDQFWNREIGQETVDLFNFALRRKLRQIMPIYNQHYRISQIKFDPLQTVNIKNVANVDGTTDTTGDSASDNSTNAKSRAVSSQFPQTQLDGNGDYATAAQDNISDTTATGSVKDKTNVAQKQVSDSSTTGFQGNPAMMLLQYRQSLVNVDMMILGDLDELFHLLWSNGDEFTERGMYFGYYGFWG